MGIVAERAPLTSNLLLKIPKSWYEIGAGLGRITAAGSGRRGLAIALDGIGGGVVGIREIGGNRGRRNGISKSSRRLC